MGAIKNFPKIFYNKISLPAEKLIPSIYIKLITSNLILLILFANLLLLTACEDEVIQPPPKPPGYQEDIPWPSLSNGPWPIYRADPQNTGRSKWTGPKFSHIEWTFDSLSLYGGVTIGEDSTIYFVATKFLTNPCGLYAVSTSGKVKWTYNFPNQALNYNTPLIGSDGTIYCGLSYPMKFYAINSDGTLKWSIDNINLKMMGINIGIDGTLYFIQSGGLLTAVSKDGNILWHIRSQFVWRGF